MKELNKIPNTRMKRAGRFARTGLKVGANYVKHYAKKAIQQDIDDEEFDRENAKEIFETLGELKGSALKIAQMMSMDREFLPAAYTDVFAMAQHQAPPLSGPLIVKTFKQHMGKSPNELFDLFEMKAVHAASIGQVHLAKKDEKKFAVKIQYPGVAESIHSDLMMVKPIAVRMMGLSEKDIAPFFEEIEIKLKEETNYELELKNSTYISGACSQLENLKFAKYYPEYSSKRILTMDWMEGVQLGTYMNKDLSQESRNKLGQTLWDLYTFQVHHLHCTHADPHPGNFLVTENEELVVLDFGCIKEIPEYFFEYYFSLIKEEIQNDPERLEKHLLALEMFYEDDTKEERELFMPIFMEVIKMLSVPFKNDTFDFGDSEFFQKLIDFGQELYKRPEIRKHGKARGNKHVLYINRTFMGLFQLLHNLKAEVKTSLFLEHIK